MSYNKDNTTFSNYLGLVHNYVRDAANESGKDMPSLDTDTIKDDYDQGMTAQESADEFIEEYDLKEVFDDEESDEDDFHVNDGEGKE